MDSAIINWIFVDKNFENNGIWGNLLSSFIDNVSSEVKEVISYSSPENYISRKIHNNNWFQELWIIDEVYWKWEWYYAIKLRKELSI